MVTLTTIPESSTVDEAVELLAALGPSVGLTDALPDARTLRLWRTQKHLTIAGRRMTRRNILEVLALLRLRRDGMTLSAAASHVRTLDEERLRLLLIENSSAPPIAAIGLDTEAAITVQQLAIGLLKQHRLVRNGAIVGHTDLRADNTPNTALELQQAMARLSRHSMLEGRPDQTASVHMLLQLCMKPLSEWAPQVIRAIARYQDAVLIDPQYRVPSEDCASIAEEVEATSLSDLIEQHLHLNLQTSLRRLGKDADAAYTSIRSFIGRHPLATREDLQQLRRNPEFNDDAIAFVNQLYEPVHGIHAVNGLVRQCNHCNGLITADNHCILSSCAETYLEPAWSKIPLDQAWLALPEVLKFWADPAREELRLYDELSRVRALRGRVQLYPHSDRCDVSIGEDIGIDVKDYLHPRRLARRLNHSIGGLSMYPRRILAIAQRRWDMIEAYEAQLLEELSADRRAALEIMSVDQAIRVIKQTARGDAHA